MEEGVVTEKTAQELQREIDELHRRQREITERLRDPRGLRKGNVFSGNARNIGMGGMRPSHAMLQQRGVLRRQDDAALEDQPPVKKRLLSTVVKVSDDQTEKVTSEKLGGQLENVPDKPDDKSSVQGTAGTEAEEGQINGSRPKLQPNFPARRDNRRGNRNFLVPADLTPVEPLPRILSKEENPSLAKRNRRMFGALLGTLEKFSQEDRQISGSDAFLRRSNSMKRAEQRAHEESERLRQQEREQLAEKRRRDLTLRARLAAKAEEKQLELLFIQWTEHHGKLCKFLRTRAEPHIFYMSAKPTGELEKVLENQQQDLLDWKHGRREELTKYQKEVGERHLANVEAEIERWQSGAGRRNSASLGVENMGNNDNSTAPTEVGLPLEARESNVEEEDADEDIEDMADDDDVGNVLEEEGAKDHGSEKELKGVVEYLSGDEDATNK